MIGARYIFILSFVAQAAWCQDVPRCYKVSSDQITGRDLAPVLPQFAAVAPDANLGYSPTPGAQHVFLVAQLKKLAEKYGVSTAISEPVCFEWSLHSLSKVEIAAAMRKSLPSRDVTLEITDQSRSLVPEGELCFPIQGFTGESDHPAIWSGFVIYAGKRRYNTWAQVRITATEKHIVATRPIATGELIDSADFKTVEYKGPLRRSMPMQDPLAVAGKCARWFLPAGTVFTDNMLVPPNDVDKEQLVTVHIDSGAAHIETQGIASDAGHLGNVIRVRNPKTGRIFRAQIEDRGVVRVVPGGMVGLVVEDKKS